MKELKRQFKRENKDIFRAPNSGTKHANVLNLKA